MHLHSITISALTVYCLLCILCILCLRSTRVLMLALAWCWLWLDTGSGLHDPTLALVLLGDYRSAGVARAT